MEQQGTRAVYRVLDLISELGHHPTGATVSALAQYLSVPAPTVHRLLRALVDRKFAVQDPASKRYLLGSHIISLANQAAGGARLAATARPMLDRLAASTRETVFLSVLDRNEIVYLDCIFSTRSVQMWGAPGMRAPLHATSQGKSLLAFLPDPALQQILSSLDFHPYTERTITDERSLRKELLRVREQGFAVNNEEHEEGVRSVSAPVLNSSGRPIATICVGVPAYRSTLAELHQKIAPDVVRTANEVASRLLGLTSSADRVEAPWGGEREASNQNSEGLSTTPIWTEGLS